MSEEKAKMLHAVQRFLKTEEELKQQLTREYLSTGLSVGIPRGAISEIYGPQTSGKASFLHHFLAESTRAGEFCALVDATNTFDPHSSVNADLTRLLWVRCIDAIQALKCADLLVHSGGWGIIILDLCAIPPQIVRKLPISYWYRFRRAVENTPTAFLVLEAEPFVKNCAAAVLQFSAAKPLWKGNLLHGTDTRIALKKAVQSESPDVRLHLCA